MIRASTCLIGALISALVGALAPISRATAQQGTAPPDSLHLRGLHAEAQSADPRQRQLRLQAAETDLRLRNIDAEMRPALSVDGQTQYQSAVTQVAIPLPGVTFPTPPHDSYDAHVGAQQSVFDPTIAARRAAERTQLADAQARIRTTLFGLTQELNDAFFTAAALQERVAETDAGIAEMDARLREAVERFQAGSALAGDTASLAATSLARRQDRLQLVSDRAAALARLSLLIGRTIPDGTPLAIPDLTPETTRALASLDQLRARPEYAQFDAARAHLASQIAVDAAQEKPRVSAFGRVGYGRPGLNMLTDTFQSYWLAGVQVHWAPWNWGTVDRKREVVELQRDVVASDEAAFTQSIRRNVQQSQATMSRLDSTLALDERIIALRQIVDTETRAKLNEGVVTAAEYVARNTELLAARLALRAHRVQLAQARATFLTTLGVEVP
jgi:outer membrane protein TolC